MIQSCNIIEAVRIGGQTLIGVNTEKYPVKRGNCFSVYDDKDNEYQIINFIAENIIELISRGLTWPIKIEVLDGQIATIADRRIPPEWYKENFCTVCTPTELLPYPQRLQQLLAIERGERDEKDGYVTIILQCPTGFAYVDKGKG